MLEQRIRELAAQSAPEIIQIRRHLHANPELSYQEFETSAYVRRRLESLGIKTAVLAKTGVVGIIEGKNPGSRVVALRADMDALPIHEENDIPYRSLVDGVMHACGHDVHTACLLGAAGILSSTRDEWEGTVKLVFQPGEEKNPGGASLMIADGVLRDPAPRAIFALHVNPQLPAGRLSFRPGMVMASADELYITVRGKGGHAAAPHFTTDTVYAASQLVVALQQVISRNRDPFKPSVLTIASIHGGNATNVIPAEVSMMGTFRAMDEEWRMQAHRIIRRICTETAAATGTEAEVKIDIGYPAVINDPELHAIALPLATNYMGAENVEETEMRMGAEDFGYYCRHIPGCFFRLGTANPALGITSGVHTSTFNIDENAIETGMGMMALFGALAIPPHSKPKVQ